MFEYDHSAARGKMVTRKLFVFEHETALGCASSHLFFETIHVERKDQGRTARNFSDYQWKIEFSKIPEGVKLIEKL